jgi:hypothetical protein
VRRGDAGQGGSVTPVVTDSRFPRVSLCAFSPGRSERCAPPVGIHRAYCGFQAGAATHRGCELTVRPAEAALPDSRWMRRVPRSLCKRTGSKSRNHRGYRPCRQFLTDVSRASAVFTVSPREPTEPWFGGNGRCCGNRRDRGYRLSTDTVGTGSRWKPCFQWLQSTLTERESCAHCIYCGSRQSVAAVNTVWLFHMCVRWSPTAPWFCGDGGHREYGFTSGYRLSVGAVGTVWPWLQPCQWLPGKRSEGGGRRHGSHGTARQSDTRVVTNCQSQRCMRCVRTTPWFCGDGGHREYGFTSGYRLSVGAVGTVWPWQQPCRWLPGKRSEGGGRRHGSHGSIRRSDDEVETGSPSSTYMPHMLTAPWLGGDSDRRENGSTRGYRLSGGYREHRLRPDTAVTAATAFPDGPLQR